MWLRFRANLQGLHHSIVVGNVCRSSVGQFHVAPVHIQGTTNQDSAFGNHPLRNTGPRPVRIWMRISHFGAQFLFSSNCGLPLLPGPWFICCLTEGFFCSICSTSHNASFSSSFGRFFFYWGLWSIDRSGRSMKFLKAIPESPILAPSSKDVSSLLTGRPRSFEIVEERI